ncbi:YjzD family protein [Halobacillus halophilus]|uniref:YjzD family protein n=1 Tax=Halobacillus halophilus TaxID=1570 RepID=UPI001CD39265|nr:YjzD family protein [Halobacillus halophilus]MCA1011320.1 YjzD family protein [Halobacillus halophilus]
MKFVWTLIWALLLSFMTAYVVSNMAGGSFHFIQVFIMTLLFTGAAVILGEGLIKDEA